jgi:hypothetical protein
MVWLPNSPDHGMCTGANSPQPQASILRQIVAGPRQQHPEAGLDLCYVTDNSMNMTSTRLSIRNSQANAVV